MRIRFRDATPEDALPVGEVHYVARADAYPAFLPPERVNWRTLAERQAQWGDFLREPGYGRDRFLVVLEAEGIAGFAAGGPQRHGDPDYPGEVWSIYILRAHQGQGCGRRLMSELARRLVPAGFPGLIVWTQGANAPARGFYEHLGGRYVRSRPVQGIDIVGYGWPDARTLL
ncbi:MAG TPA: GNAT family N-acetyltransferase [Planctomycetota bacterium]|nr:GNAT family N-acetyltransferase [Planctomycetota bacterium]